MQALGLSCPEDLFDSHFFQEDPGPFYKFARQVRSVIVTLQTNDSILTLCPALASLAVLSSRNGRE
jgi:NAD-dependent SIR2 family protein deacetylase